MNQKRRDEARYRHGHDSYHDHRGSSLNKSTSDGFLSRQPPVPSYNSQGINVEMEEMSRAVKVSCSKLSNSFIDIFSCHDCRIPLHPTTLTYRSHFPIQPRPSEPEYTIRTAGRLGQLPTKIHSEEEDWMILSSAGQDTTLTAMAEVDTNQASETTGSRG